MLLRIIFAGTSDFAAIHLSALLSSKYKVIGVFTKPDSLSGRGKKLTLSPVKILAKKRGIPIFQPTSFFIQENQKLVANLNADIMVVVAYGLILPEPVLNMPNLGCINVHGSLLPRWRGAAPVQRSILAGDIKTGITIIKMNVGLDTGDILYKISCLISNNETSFSLYKKLARLGTRGLLEVIKKILANKIKPEVQDESYVTYAKKINKEEARIDWFLPAIQLERSVRAFINWPVSWIKFQEKPIKIWKASVIQNSVKVAPGTIIESNKHGIQVATVEGILNLELLQPSGKKIMKAQDFLNSRYKWFTPGTKLS